MKKKYLFIFMFFWANFSFAQTESNKAEKWKFGFQYTTITQYKPSFSAKYSGENSLLTEEESKTSLTSTMYFGYKLGKRTEIYVNPELAGGSGLSKALGVAGFPNGETFRVGSPDPKIYLARAYLKHTFPLSDENEMIADEQNQFIGEQPTSYFSVVAGKFSMADFFDKNKYSHDPRTQFQNWSLMSNGAWDYAADVRGYTLGIMFELSKATWAIRFASALLPKVANGAEMDFTLREARSETIEFDKSYRFGSQKGTIRLLAFRNQTNMGSYAEARNMSSNNIDITLTRTEGRTKYGFGLNIEHDFNQNIGFFGRLGWNDGQNETWVFTEIDQTTSLGMVLNGNLWKRKADIWGIAWVMNGISEQHQGYLKAGGKGFMLGDGNLNYAPELIGETYYSFSLGNFLTLSPNYQFIINPAYNADRGLVHVFSLRCRVEI
ncbi:MAG: carbohydrate porin [Bacteroidetes bacterium]|nr:MAG: carbohydrate porin [Bacteroidota bacterium]